MTLQATRSIRWPLAIGAGVLSELAVIVLLSVIILTYRFLVAPGQESAVYERFGHRTGHFVAPLAAGLATMVFTVWAGGRLNTAFVLNGLAIGVVGVICAAGFIFVAPAEERFMYIVSYVLRIVGGVGGGVIAAGLAAARHGTL